MKYIMRWFLPCESDNHQSGVISAHGHREVTYIEYNQYSNSGGSPKTPDLDTQTSPSNNPPPDRGSDHDPRKFGRTKIVPSK